MSELLQKIHPQVYRIPADFGLAEVQLYLLLGDQLALVDTGIQSTVGDYIVPALSSLNLKLEDLDYIINTHAHPDHVGGNFLMKKSEQTQFMIHEDDRELASDPEAYVKSKYDVSRIYRLIGREDLAEKRRQYLLRHVGRGVPFRLFQDGDELDLGRGLMLRVLHTPGHTAGSICLYWEQEGMLLTGDSVQGRGILPGCLPLYFHAADYMRSIKRLVELPARLLCLGHAYQTGGWENPPVRQGAAASRSIRESLEVSERIDAAVSEVVASSGPRTLTALTHEVLMRLQYDLPVILDRHFGAPLHSLTAVEAHLRAKGQEDQLAIEI